MIFPHAFLDSSSCWNSNHNHLHLQQIGSNTHITTTPSPAGPGDERGSNNNNHGQEGLMAMAGAGGGSGDGGGFAGDGDGSGTRNSKSMSMPERARWARMPQPEAGLNCPRCESTNTKFCYFNNYSLTQPRHFCRACRRYWTRSGALRNVPVGGGYRRRHAKRTAKPTAASAARATVTRTSTTPSITAGTTGMATATSGLQYSMFGSAPLFADFFDPESLGLSFPDSLLFAHTGAYVADDGGDHNHHHQGGRNDVEQRAAVQMHNHPFLHTMDHQMSGPPAAAIPTTMVAMHGMIHLGPPNGGGDNGEEGGGHHQFQHHQSMIPAKGDHHQQQQNCPSSRGMYGDIANGGGGYNFYSSTTNAGAARN